MHNKGLIHNDLHPGNFLIKNNRIYLLDGASIKKDINNSVSKERGFENLSVLLAQMDLGKEAFLELLNAYVKVRGLGDKKQYVVKLKKHIKKRKKKSLKNHLLLTIYSKKISILVIQSRSIYSYLTEKVIY